MEIILTKPEMIQASEVGIRRNIVTRLSGAKRPYGASKEDGWRFNIEGAMAECAVAKALNVYWPGYGTFAGQDITGYEVRSTERETGRLIIKRKDHDNIPYILATGTFGTYQIRGWLYAKDAKKDEYLAGYRENGENYFVPQKFLNDLESLPR